MYAITMATEERMLRKSSLHFSNSSMEEKLCPLLNSAANDEPPTVFIA